MGLQRRADRGEQVQPGSAPPPKLAVRRGPDGKIIVAGPADLDRSTLRTAVEGAERPGQPDDPRSGPMRDVPPIGPA